MSDSKSQEIEQLKKEIALLRPNAERFQWLEETFQKPVPESLMVVDFCDHEPGKPVRISRFQVYTGTNPMIPPVNMQRVHGKTLSQAIDETRKLEETSE